MEVGQIIVYAAGAGMGLWMAWAVGAALYGYFADEIKVARQHGEPTKSGVVSGVRGLLTCLVIGILIVIAIGIVVNVGSSIWGMLFGASHSSEFDEYAM